ncbi:hypothetical protein TeGR_g438, partial [Tetraparma gracilis]
MAERACRSADASILRTHELTPARTLTRVERFVPLFPDWRSLCGSGGSLSSLLGALFSTPPWPLFKEKLNLKPPGGRGFAAHLDGPSLAAAGVGDGARMLTVMLAIDAMTRENGCLQYAPGAWNPGNAAETEAPRGDDPDSDGRLGALTPEAEAALRWELLPCGAGGCYVFGGCVPHRSGGNGAAFARRAVFLTYSHPDGGDLREEYYGGMGRKREAFRRGKA